jgi:predicted alpha/beta-hydrolase family hydrolase
MDNQTVRFPIAQSGVIVSGLLRQPKKAKWIFVLAHGAGAGMNHPFLESIAEGLSEHDIATLRFQFPYMEQGRRAPNSRPVLAQTIRSAIAAAKSEAPGLRIVAGGKSMGGRMTSLAQSEAPLEDVEGLIFLGFPLHAQGRESTERGSHLAEIQLPMLFLQGTRDKLAKPSLMKTLCESLGEQTTLHILKGGDHSFKPLKSSGRTYPEVIDEAVVTTSEWIKAL